MASKSRAPGDIPRGLLAPGVGADKAHLLGVINLPSINREDLSTFTFKGDSFRCAMQSLPWSKN